MASTGTSNPTDNTILSRVCRRSAPRVSSFTDQRLRPAILARYRDLSRLRYDYPLVLCDQPADDLRPLTEIFNELLSRIAPRGPSGERLRRHTLRLEGQIRELVAAGKRGSLGQLWEMGQSRALEAAASDDRADLATSLSEARAALDDLDGSPADSAVLDCTPADAVEMLTHAWQAIERRRLAPLVQRLGLLIGRLTDILKADWARSAEARTPAAVAAALGSIDSVDPAALSRMLSPLPTCPLPPSRVARIKRTLETLRSQRFVALGSHGNGVRPPIHSFQFDSCASALAHYRRRLPELLALVRAMRIAALEIENAYREPEHDELFARLDLRTPTAQELAQFPSYFVRLRSADLPEVEKALLMDALASRLPLKVLVDHDDLLSDPHAPGSCGPDGWGARLGLQAMGLASAFVLQTPASHIPLLAARIAGGLQHSGPALFSVYVGRPVVDGDLPSYLQTAAALQCRAFAAFVYDPDAGDGLAARFDITANPHPHRAWPVTAIEAADPQMQRFELELPFTWADFVACDRRCAAQFLALDESSPDHETSEQLRPIWMVDEDDTLRRVLAGPDVREGMQRCAERWRALQELAGVNSSLVERALLEARQAWEAERGAVKSADDPPRDAPSASPVLQANATDQPTPPNGAPHVESWRCTSCNECITASPNLFAYDDNKQAFVKDAAAGTFRQLVEAAERCQLAIIHPGEPNNPDEPDLDALRERARPFNATS